jgi:hypothetical protein
MGVKNIKSRMWRAPGMEGTLGGHTKGYLLQLYLLFLKLAEYSLYSFLYHLVHLKYFIIHLKCSFVMSKDFRARKPLEII